jgi:hypothetical protein
VQRARIVRHEDQPARGVAFDAGPDSSACIETPAHARTRELPLARHRLGERLAAAEFHGYLVDRRRLSRQVSAQRAVLRIELQRERQRLRVERHAVDGDRADRHLVSADAQQRQTRNLLAVVFEEVQDDARSLAGELGLR